MNIALLGFGTVGSHFYKMAQEHPELNVSAVLSRRPRPELTCTVTADFDELVRDRSIDLVVEVMGGVEPAFSYLSAAMRAGKHVVTANKQLMCAHYEELLSLAEENGVSLRCTAAAGGGIPWLTSLARAANMDAVDAVEGILNGTTNYMLSAMTGRGANYDAILKEAQAQGYAERNPEADVEGKDAARKIAILASIAFNSRVKFEDVSMEGITKITPEDISYAAELGYVVKLLAVARQTELGIDVRVNPVFLAKTHPLAAVSGVLNAIFVRGYPIEEAMFFGPGAGKPTASAVVSDIIEIARGLNRSSTGRFSCTCYYQFPICPVEETVSSYYIRLLVDDKPGVLGKIATTFGNVDVSLKSVVQTKAELKDHVEIVVITHKVKHKNILAAQTALKILSVVDEIFNVIRVE